jgi:hypothetical protein
MPYPAHRAPRERFPRCRLGPARAAARRVRAGHARPADTRARHAHARRACAHHHASHRLAACGAVLAVAGRHPGAARPAATTSRPGADARSGPSPEELFASWDRDRNKSLSLDEFRAGIEQGRQASLMTRLGALFRTADVNRNGKLEAPNTPACR